MFFLFFLFIFLFGFVSIFFLNLNLFSILFYFISFFGCGFIFYSSSYSFPFFFSGVDFSSFISICAMFYIYLHWFCVTYVYYIVFFLIKVICLLIAVAYTTLAERKIMSSMQRRKGPNVVGIFGLLQPLADGLKLLFKETIIPNYSNPFLFFFAPVITFACSLILWSVMPFESYAVNNSFVLLFVLTISSFAVYGLLFSGWSSNSKYAFLGGVRSAAQMISYEVNLGMIIMHVFLLTQSFSLYDVIDYQRAVWFVFPLLPVWILFFISALAETNRAPFDLPEAEAELVAGYNVEYSSMGFVLFFLGEYGNIVFMSIMSSFFFWGGGFFFGYYSFLILGIKVALHVFLFVWVRAAFPRFRYDHLMRLGWKVFLPLTLASFIFYSFLGFIFLCP